MLNTLIRQLNNPDPEQRKKAVKALAQTKDPAVLKYLATVVKNDDDAEVRDLAVKAGRYIKKQTASQDDYDYEPSSRSSSSGGTASYLTEDDSYPEKAEKHPYDSHPDDIQVSDGDIERAQGLVDQALDWQMRGNNDKAAEHLTKAFQTNPRLKTDSYTMGVASSVTGLNPDEAVRLLTAAPQKKKKNTARSSEPNWGDALIDLVIYGIVTGAAVGVSLLLIFNLMIAPTLKTGQQGTLPPGTTPFDVTQVINLLSSRGAMFVLIIGVAVGVVAIIMLVVQYFAIHLTATAILGGEGSLVGLIRKLTLFLTGANALSLAGAVGGIFIGITNRDTANTISGITLVFNLIVLILFAQRVGSNYQFGIGKGCSTVIVATIILAVFFGCILPMLFSSGTTAR